MAHLWRAIMEEHRASMDAYKKVHKETVRSEMRMAILQQSMEMDIWEIKEKLAERRELLEARSRGYSNQNNSMAEIQVVEDSTKPMTTGKSSEDGGILEELMFTSAVEKTDFTEPILAANKDLGLKLIDDLDEPLMVLESDGRINKNEFVVVAPVAAVAHVAVAPIEQSSAPLGRKIKQKQAEHHKMFIWQIILKLGWEICLGYLSTNVRLKQELVPAQRRTWDPGITQCDILKQHLEDKVFLGAGVLI